MPNWMLKNSDAQPSGSFTFATISFIVVTFLVIFSAINVIKIGAISIMFQPVDTTLALGYLAASFSTYVVRRTTTGATVVEPEKQ
jgi:dolichol kinase